MEGDARGHRQALALHPGGQVAVAVDVLAAAHPAADRALPAHDLRQQAVRVAEPGQVVAVAPVVAEHEVGGAQQGAQRHRHVLLAQAGVRGAVQLAPAVQLEQLQLEVPDQQQQFEVVVGQAGEPGPAGRRVEGRDEGLSHRRGS
nr:hypothetical protein GCM10020093_104310 [Planobispora longispora]